MYLCIDVFTITNDSHTACRVAITAHPILVGSVAHPPGGQWAGRCGRRSQARDATSAASTVSSRVSSMVRQRRGVRVALVTWLLFTDCRTVAGRPPENWVYGGAGEGVQVRCPCTTRAADWPPAGHVSGGRGIEPFTTAANFGGSTGSRHSAASKLG